MYKYIFVLFVSVFSGLASTALAEWDLFPALYSVTGVASNDSLNVRSGPTAQDPIVTTFAYNQQQIEIVRLSDNGKWGMIGMGEGNGWTSMRYLARQAGQTGNDLPRPLNCGGNEPFWALNFNTDANIFGEPGQPDQPLTSIWEGVPQGSLATAYGAKLVQPNAEINATIARTACSDGMSERDYGFEINAILSGSLGNRMLTGCCTIGN